MNCPACGSRNLGKIAKNQYYCRDCYREIKFGPKGTVQLAVIAQNGRLLPYKITKCDSRKCSANS